MSTFFAWLSQRWKKFREVIILEGKPYLYRYRLWYSSRLGVYLHCIVATDTDRNLHDHPFDFTTVILWGGYYEHSPSGRRWCGPGSIIQHKAEDLHRIELSRPAWTLFLRGPERRAWGFQTPDGWVLWRQYEKLGEYASEKRKKHE